MTRTSWNIRDSTTDTLKELLARKYKEINAEYKMLHKVAKIEDAKKIIDEIWRIKGFANGIEMELMRREFRNGISEENEADP